MSKTISRALILILLALLLIVSTAKMPRKFSDIEHALTSKYVPLIESAAIQGSRITIAPLVHRTTRTRPDEFLRFPIVTSDDLTEEDRQWILSLENDLGWTRRGLCSLFEGLNHKAIGRWAFAVARGLPTKSSVGRPTKLTPSQVDIVEVSLYGYSNRSAATYQQAHRMINELAEVNYRSSHPFASPSQVHSKSLVSSKTEARIFQIVDFDEHQAKRVTEWRRKACESMRHSFSWGVSMMTFVGKSPPWLKSNADGTTVTIRFDELNGQSVMVPRVLRDEDKGRNLRPEVYGASEMDLLVKHMHLSSATGETDGMCLIFQDKNIPEGEFYYYELQHMNCTTSKVNCCIYFCKSRAGNAAMWQHWQHWLITKVIPFCHRLRQHNLDGDEQLPAVLSTDGEPIILNEAFSDAVMKALDEFGVIWVRVPASTTSIHQACDRSMFFIKFNSGFVSKTMMRDFCSLTVTNGSLTDELLRLIHYPGVTTGFVNKVIRACLYIEFVVSKTLSKYDVMASFEVCGQHQQQSSDGWTVNFRKIMNQCHTEIDEATMANLESQMTETGALSWEDMDEKKISNEDSSFDRTGSTIARRASEVISHPNTRAKKRTWDLEHDPEVIKARRLIEKDVIDKAKKAAKIQAKADAEIAKQLRAQASRAMSKEERARGVQERKRLTQEKKEEKEEDEKAAEMQRQEDLANARTFLASLNVPMDLD